MRCSGAIVGLLLLAPISARGDDRPLDWVKVTERAGWQARDSSGEVVYKGRLWLLGGWFDSFSARPETSGAHPTARPGRSRRRKPPGRPATCR